MKQESKLKVGNTNEAVSIVNSDGKFVDVNEELSSLLKYSPDELIGSHVSDYIVGDKMKAGMSLQKAFTGSHSGRVNQVQLGDGSVAEIETEFEKIEQDGETLLRATNTLVNSTEKSEGYDLEEMDSGRLSEITENIRIETSSGTMTVEEVMFDLMVGENEVTKYKKGALSLHQAIDERLEEEMKRNPDSEEVAVLKEARDAAFSLYERIQNGDRNSGLT